MKVPLFNPAVTDAEVELDLESVVRSGVFVDGPERDAFEDELAAHLGVRYAVTVASGTGALEAALRFFGSEAERVAVPGNTFKGTVSAIRNARLVPAFTDVDENGLMLDPEVSVEGCVPVDLCGHEAPYRPGRLWALSDGCQSLWGSIPACISFHPTKPLGTYGHGGAVLTDDRDLAMYVKRWRWHGPMGGRNSRLPELQAHVLRRKLPFVDKWIAERRRIARIYQQQLALEVTQPEQSHWHTFPVKVPRGTSADALVNYLARVGVQTKRAYGPLSDHAGVMDWARRVVYLPIWAGMTYEQIRHVIGSCNEWGAQC